MSLVVQAFHERTAAADGMGALTRLRQMAGAAGDYQAELVLARLAATVPRTDDLLEPLRVAVLSSATVDHFVPVLKARLLLAGYEAEIFVPPFDTVSQTVYGADSELYTFGPDVVWFQSHYRDAPAADVDALVAWWRVVQGRCPAFIVQNSFDLPSEQAWGNLAGCAPHEPTASLRRLNMALVERTAAAGVALLDMDQISAEFGRGRWCDARYWHHSKHSFALDAYGLVAHRFARLVAGARGRSAKCVALDLDDTLWGGVVGEVGVDGIELGEGADGEAFVAWQSYLKRLQERGILLAVCSKNDEETARAPFLRHPDMRLRLDDFVAFKASWRNKAESLTELAEELHLRADAIVFVDNDPVERDLVRSLAPQFWVPELSDDPAELVAAVDAMRYFETVSVSPEDAGRTELYRQDRKREDQRRANVDLNDYLQSLHMKAAVVPLSGLALQRGVQLVNKSNQFNLSGDRLVESAVAENIGRGRQSGFCLRLLDRFGDNGIVALVLLSKSDDDLRIDTWAMSCRVLARGVEEFTLEELMRLAQEQGARRLVGRWVDSGRNRLVQGLYQRLGFERTTHGDGWEEWSRHLASAPTHFIARSDSK